MTGMNAFEVDKYRIKPEFNNYVYNGTYPTGATFTLEQAVGIELARNSTSVVGHFLMRLLERLVARGIINNEDLAALLPHFERVET